MITKVGTYQSGGSCNSSYISNKASNYCDRNSYLSTQSPLLIMLVNLIMTTKIVPIAAYDRIGKLQIMIRKLISVTVDQCHLTAP